MHEATFKTIATVVGEPGCFSALVTIIFASPDSKLGSGRSYQGEGATAREALRAAHEQIFAAVEGK